jgi:hypothetical protein
MMSLPLVISPEAEEDLVEAKLWYDNQRSGLGDGFVRRVDEVLKLIQAMARSSRI